MISQWSKAARTLPTRKDWESLVPYIDRALADMEDKGYEAGLIIVPHAVPYEYLWRAGKFRALDAKESASGLPSLCGFYKDIPVLRWRETPQDHLLVVDVGEASQLEVEREKAGVEALSESEIAKMLQEDTSLGRRGLELSVRVSIEYKARVKILNRNAIVKLRLKLPKARTIIAGR